MQSADPQSSHESPRVALVAAPWALVDLPSIQVATLAAALRMNGLSADVIELYPDFARRLGVEQYRTLLRTARPPILESIFTRYYFHDHETEIAAAIEKSLVREEV